ncbi:MAG: hypothetical protein AB1546_03970, partial [bacterium]
GGARFIILDNCSAEYQLTDEQMKWLEDALKTDLIKFVFMHAPPSTHLWTDGFGKNSENFMELVEKYEVKKVYFGHDHAYDKLRRGKTDYIMTGCGGAEPNPIARYYDRFSGGYYHMILVEIKDGKVMDVLVAPDTSDIISFPSPDGAQLEFPFGSYRHFNTPVVESAGIVGGSWKANAPTGIAVTAYSDPAAMEAGLVEVTVECTDTSGKRYGPVSLKSEPFDERKWSGEMPPIAGAPVLCSLRAEDVLGSSILYLTPIKTASPGAPPAADSKGTGLSSIPYNTVSTDINDAPVKLPGTLDLLNFSMAYDEGHFYFLVETEEGFSGGDRKEGTLNTYLVGFLDEKLKLEADPRKMLKAIPILIYAPLAPTMGFPKCGFYNFGDYKKGNIEANPKGVVCREEGKKLYLSVDRNLPQLKGLEGIKFIVASGQLLLREKLDVKIGDATNVTNVKLSASGIFK